MRSIDWIVVHSLVLDWLPTIETELETHWMNAWSPWWISAFHPVSTRTWKLTCLKDNLLNKLCASGVHFVCEGNSLGPDLQKGISQACWLFPPQPTLVVWDHCGETFVIRCWSNINLFDHCIKLLNTWLSFSCFASTAICVCVGLCAMTVEHAQTKVAYCGWVL